jgi:anaerobic carbon-monoxide dehydrogenase iron sulfur subunit
MKVLQFYPERCTGCGICEQTCAETYFKVADPDKSAIRILAPGAEGVHYSATFCNQCGECIDVCPVQALSRNKLGIVHINKKLCVGCYACVGFCPILVMRTHPKETFPFKCVACGKCVKACPEGALEIVQLENAAPSETEKWAERIALAVG